MAIRVTRLARYPIKSCAAQYVDSLFFLSGRGVMGDRQFMVVDEAGQFVSQRSSVGMGIAIPEMATIMPELHNDCLYVIVPGMPELELHIPSISGPRLETRVWNKHVAAVVAPEYVSEWFTEYLSQFRPGTYRLVMFEEDFRRRSPEGASHLMFADRYPVLLVSEASIELLSEMYEMPEDFDFRRFRPNIVIGSEALDPFVEDRVASMHIGDMLLTDGGPCERCAMIDMDQETGDRDDPIRVSRVLHALGRSWVNKDGKPGLFFGRHLNCPDQGVIQLGDEVILHTD